MIDVTIIYPYSTPGLWQFVSGQVKKISVSVRLLPIGVEVCGKNFREDAVAKKALKTWLNDLWTEKEQYIASRTDHTLKSGKTDDN